MLNTARNIAIIALLALIITVAPGSDNFVNAVLAALTLTFLAAMGMLAAQTWKQTSLTRDVMTDRQRMVFYGALGAIALMVAGADEMFSTGGGTVAWLLIVGTSGYLLFTTWRQASSY
jgi:hypothetical protein